ncbi:MAG TPA: hypothetical protein VNI55_02260 [Gaiellaceae bacterium]|nr:hypothetical protein [Gaiellaceae bacterium]
MTYRVCPKHGLVPTNKRCCASRNQQRRWQADKELGRTTAHWKRLRATATHRAHSTCSRCGTAESDHDAGSKLTCDLIGGGDHSRATLDQVRVLCKRCHGHGDGGRRTRKKLGAK